MAVYFIRAGENGPVKIGYAADVASRMAFMQSGNHTRLVLLREIEGDTRTERALHKRFVEYKIDREWFNFCPDMLTVDAESLAKNECVASPHARAVDELGGAIALGKLLNVKADTIRRWRLNGKIPSQYWPSIQAVSGDRITIDMLARSAPQDGRAA